MLGRILIAAGLILAVGSLLIGFYLVNLGCSMGGAFGCDQDGLELMVELMKSSDGALFWVAVAIGFVMISVGYKLKASVKRDT